MEISERQNKTICISGGFDPLHAGHLRMFKEAAKHGSLTIILNSDAWLLRKKGFCFLPWEQRAEILRDLRSVVEVIEVDDADETICEALRRLRPDYLAYGGDCKQAPTPEMELCAELGIGLLWNIGGCKIESSSDIARRAWVKRSWGQYVALEEGENFKVKKLMVAPGQSISLQYHKYRDEYWYVMESVARISLDEEVFEVKAGDEPVRVRVGVRHQLTNIGDVPLVVIEIQSGEYLGEDDIIRLSTASPVHAKILASA